jgi:hypothetical protein
MLSVATTAIAANVNSQMNLVTVDGGDAVIDDRNYSVKARSTQS